MTISALAAPEGPVAVVRSAISAPRSSTSEYVTGAPATGARPRVVRSSDHTRIVSPGW